VHQIVENKSAVFYPITTGRTLHTMGADYMMKQYTAVYAEKAKVLREMAEKSDCIIVGRCAGYILRDMNPLRVFVYAKADGGR
jgi:cytidylate kinase